MKKLAIMQPYLFPYLGYFQLIKAVDQFVIYDDVQYINKGWINRNQILVNSKPLLFTFGLKKSSSRSNINKKSFSDTFEKDKSKFFRTLESSYHRAPYYSQAITLINQCLDTDNLDIVPLITKSLQEICSYIGLTTEFTLSSDIKKNNSLIGEEKIIHICKFLEADCYINAIGGLELYSPEHFLFNGLKLLFIQPGDIRYHQFSNEFVSNLSIIDGLMFNSPQELYRLVSSYHFLPSVGTAYVE